MKKPVTLAVAIILAAVIISPKHSNAQNNNAAGIATAVGGLMAIGLTFSLVFQALVNMAVAVNLFPVTGQPLPLISMGGTSMIFTMITLGIILSVSKNNTNETIENLETV